MECHVDAIREDFLEKVMSEQGLKGWGGAGKGARGSGKRAVQAKATGGVFYFPWLRQDLYKSNVLEKRKLVRIKWL